MIIKVNFHFQLKYPVSLVVLCYNDFICTFSCCYYYTNVILNLNLKASEGSSLSVNISSVLLF